MNTFYVDILTPERVFYQGECLSLIVPITDGMIGIMANREPITASITRGEAYYTTPDGEKVLFSVSGGIVDVSENRVRVLCEEALLPDEIDEEALLARARLLEQQRSHEDAVSQIMMKNAINHLRVKRKTQN